jgi:mannose/cellobiose epimerase-like protein (N-acyl-D-glucosamine 2-epimerase family)
MIYACLKAYETTGDTSYADKAIEIAEWFFGNNPAGQQMYFPENGKCFDGINNENELNKNSGAESTIEALLALLEIENNPVAKQIFNKKMEILFENAINK